jgi:glucose-6-phosphate dehydrogenase assembly protein OpcA
MAVVAGIDPEKILSELRELWIDLGRRREGAGGVLRACSMTLIAVAERNDQVPDEQAVHETIGVLMHDHPSRAIVILPREEAGFSARVFSECWLPVGRECQICTDGIEITADPERSDELARLLVPLTAEDLPVVLWCRGPRAFLDRTLDPLFPLADKIIFDTAHVRHAPSAISFLKRMRKDGIRVADLAWTRLTPWREAIAHLFDAMGRPEAVTEVRLLYGGTPDTRILHIASWIGVSLPGVLVRTVAEEGGPGLHAVAFRTPAGEFSVRRQDKQFHVDAGTHSYSSAVPVQTEQSLMHEELSILSADPVFEEVLHSRF